MAKKSKKAKSMCQEDEYPKDGSVSTIPPFVHSSISEELTAIRNENATLRDMLQTVLAKLSHIEFLVQNDSASVASIPSVASVPSVLLEPRSSQVFVPVEQPAPAVPVERALLPLEQLKLEYDLHQDLVPPKWVPRTISGPFSEWLSVHERYFLLRQKAGNLKAPALLDHLKQFLPLTRQEELQIFRDSVTSFTEIQRLLLDIMVDYKDGDKLLSMNKLKARKHLPTEPVRSFLNDIQHLQSIAQMSEEDFRKTVFTNLQPVAYEKLLAKYESWTNLLAITFPVICLDLIRQDTSRLTPTPVPTPPLVESKSQSVLYAGSHVQFEKICSFCKKPGHLAVVCLKKKKSMQYGSDRPRFPNNYQTQSPSREHNNFRGYSNGQSPSRERNNCRGHSNGQSPSREHTGFSGHFCPTCRNTQPWFHILAPTK